MNLNEEQGNVTVKRELRNVSGKKEKPLAEFAGSSSSGSLAVRSQMMAGLALVVLWLVAAVNACSGEK